MKKIALLLLSCAFTSAAWSQINITGGGFTYMEDFNTLDSNTTNSSNLPAGWAIKEIGTSTSTVNNMYRSGSGTANSGDTYSFGSPGSADRALGSIASGSNAPSFGAKFMNTSSTDTITKILMDFTVEQWRAGDTSSMLDTTLFMYSLVADSVGDTVAANWIAVPAMNLNSVNPSGAGIALDGNMIHAMMSDSFNVVIPPGGHIVIKWIDRNVAGSDDGLAVDDLTMMFKSSTVINSVKTVDMKHLDMSVLGAATANSIKLGFATEGGMYHLSVTDLSGRVVFGKNIQTQAGAQQYTLSDLNLTGGLYIIKLTDGQSAGIVKAIVE